jgi:hypothetical protein
MIVAAPNWKKIQEVLGIQFDQSTLKEIKKAPLAKNQPLTHSLMAEATIKSLLYPSKVAIDKVCKNCQGPFFTSYDYVAYCSDQCRRTTLAKDFGIDWVEDSYRGKNEIQVWGGRVPPGIIPPEALAVMKYLVEKAEKRLGSPIEPWNPQQLSKPTSSPSAPSEPELVSQLDIEALMETESLDHLTDSLAELLKDLD